MSPLMSPLRSPLRPSEAPRGITYTIVLMGDVDGDGEISAADANALRHAAKLDSLEGPYFLAADMNRDGKVLPNDARKILRIEGCLTNLPFPKRAL